MNQKRINALKRKAWDVVELYPIEDVLTEVYRGPQKKRGNYIHFHCPNGCGSKHNDCCKVNLTTNLAHCFACGWGGNAATIYASFKGIDNMEAALLLACRAGELSKQDVSEILESTSNFNKLISDSKSHVNLLEKKSEEEAEYLAPVTVRNIVYTTLLTMKEFRLSEEGYRYLVNVRNLSDSQIKERMFFTYNESFSIDELIEKCKKIDDSFTCNSLWGVPGFYFVYTDENKTKGHWRFKAPIPNGLGIPLMDGEGMIQALQIRNMSKDAKLRYFFISSRNEKNAAYNSSPGTPAAVCYPQMVKSGKILFTEGIFKAMEGAKGGNVSIAIQGVNNYSVAIDQVQVLLQSNLLKEKTMGLPRQKLSFLIAFDSDMFENVGVLKAALLLQRDLKNKFHRNVDFLVWDKNYGKGLDDMKYYAKEHNILYKKLCFVVDSNDFIRMVAQSQKKCDAYFGVTKENADKIRKEEQYSIKLREELWTNRVSKIFNQEGAL